MQDRYSVSPEVSSLLEEAKALEDNAYATAGDAPPERALLEQSSSKYYEACFLMKGQEEFAKIRSHYELHAQGLREKVEGLKISDKQKSKEKRAIARQGGHGVDADNDRDRNGESERKKKVSARASESLRTARSAGKTFLKKAKGKCLKRAGKQDQKQVSSKVKNPQDCVQSNWLVKLEVEKYRDNADRLLGDALNNDERGDRSTDILIDQYMEAMRCYSRAIEILSSSEGGEKETASEGESPIDINSMRKRNGLALRRVEELKCMAQSDGPATSSQAALPPPAPAQVNINQESGQNHSVSQPKSLTQAEIEILKWSSHIASGVFLPWSEDEARRFNESPDRKWLGTCESKEPPLSDKQKEGGCRWARPAEVAAMRVGPCRIAMVDSITPYTIKQHCVEDCSFVAGLCISAAFEHRFDRRLVSSLIHPQDPMTGMPIYNPQGVYMVKLWLNGVARRVLLDDKLPVDEHGNLLCSHTTASGKSNGGVLELWVPILEKAYMTLCGGYGFPGSNSGVDLFSLTGWIPERMFLPEDPDERKDSETPVERAWERLDSATSYGDCLITLSTSKELSEEEAEEVGLFTGHAYAVLGVVETSNGTRLLKLKNPWACNSWKGRFSPQDEDSWKDPKFCEEVGYNSSSSSRYDDGVFWMALTDIVRYFRNLHLSWNPALFRSRTAIHGYWPEDLGPNDDSSNIGENPQYTMTLSDEAIKSKATLWILLSRHVTKQEQEGGGVSDFLTLHLYRVKNPRQRVWYSNSNCILTGTYTNNQHVLVRYDVKGPEDKVLSIVLSQYEKRNNIAYTLSCYGTEKFELGDPEQLLPMYQELPGAWQLRDKLGDKSNSLSIGTAGGPLNKGSFGSNPQWSIRVPYGGVSIQVKCMAPKNMHVNIILVKINSSISQQSDDNDQIGRRIHHLYKNPTIDTGPHREEFAVSDIVFLQAGLYTLCANTLEVGQVGNFLLHVFSSSEVHIREIG